MHLVLERLMRRMAYGASCAVERTLCAGSDTTDLIHHGDRGPQGVSIKCTEGSAEAGIEPSVGCVGDSYKNALAETMYGLFKAEEIRPKGPWRNIEDVEFAALEWVDRFNNRGLLEPIGDIRPRRPPADFEAMYYEGQEGQAIAA